MYEKREELFEKTSKDLEAGHLSQDVIDQLRLPNSRDEASGVNKAFQEYMTALTQLLLGDQYDPEKHKFRFMITADSEPNASIIKKANPPIILFSKGLLKKLETHDHVAAVLAHEITHKLLDSHANSKFEEAAADAWPVYALYKAGLNPRAGIEVIDLLTQDEQEADLNLEDQLLYYLDPHPRHPMRRRIIENTMFALLSDEGLSDFDVESKHHKDLNHIHENLQSIQHESYVDRLLSEHDYYAKSVTEKMDFWTSQIPGIFSPSAMFYKNRVADIARELKCFGAKCFDPNNDAALNRLIDRIMIMDDVEAYSNTKKDFYDALVTNGHSVQKIYEQTGRPVIGSRLQGLQRSMEGFIYSIEPDEIKKHASSIVKNSHDLTFPGSSLMFHMEWPQFYLHAERTINATWERIAFSEDTERQEGLVPYWAPHVEAALQEDGNDIARTLFAMGIKDPRIVKKCGQDAPKFTQWNRHLGPYQALMFNDKGHIVGSQNSFKELTKRSINKGLDEDYLNRVKRFETQRLKSLDQQSQDLLESGSVDWEQLRTQGGFTHFIGQHQYFLEPQITNLPDNARFARAFMEQIDQLMQEDPTRYGPWVKDFFAATTYEIDSEDAFSDEIKPTPTLTTVLDMIKYRTTGLKNYHMDISPRSGYGFMCDLGIRYDHPYIQFMVEDPYDLFAVEDKIELLAHAHFMTRKDTENFENPDFRMTQDLRSVFKYPKPQTPDDLQNVLNILEAYQYDNPEENGRNICVFFQTMFEIAVFFENHDGAIDAELFRQCSKHRQVFGDGPFSQRLEKAFDIQLEKNKKQDFSKDAYGFIETYRIYGAHDLFTRQPEIQKQYDNRFVKHLEALPNNNDTQAILEKLIFDARIDCPDLRKKIVQKWVDCIVSMHGFDDQSEAHFIKMDKIARRLLNGFKEDEEEKKNSYREKVKNNRNIVFDMLGTLAEASQMQERLAFHMRDLLQDSLKDSLTGTAGHLTGAGSEYGMAVLGQEPRIRMAMIDFLTSRLTPESTKGFYQELQPLEHDTSRRMGRSKFFHFFSKTMGYLAHNSSEEQRLNALAVMHNNFWSMPIEARAFYVEKMVFPVDQDDDGDFHACTEMIMDKILPRGHQYTDLGRLIINSYMDNVPQYGQRLLLSALMVASEEQLSEQNQEENIGRALASILMNLEPAGVKLAQAIHSHPDTPEAIRKGMGDVKGRSNLPFRWDVFTRINAVLPKAIREDIKHFGFILGGGAYQYTVETTKQSGLKTAMSFLRRNVRPKAKKEFSNFTNAAKDIIRCKPEFAPLRDIIAQASRSSDIETNYDLGEKQSKIAETIYNDLSITVEREAFTFSTVEWLDHGEDWKDSSKAIGTAFNDLSTETDEDQDFKRKAGKAILIAEMFNILSGYNFDHDSHGSNLNIQDHHITRYDHGAMSLDAPDEEMQKLLGEALGRSMRKAAFSSSKKWGSILFNELSDAAKGATPQQAEYLATVQRGVLALGDYMKDMDTKDLKDVMNIVINREGLSPIITEAAKSKLGVLTFLGRAYQWQSKLFQRRPSR